MKLWTGRFSKEADKITNDFNSSIGTDKRMYREDIQGSIAHATMLGMTGIITAEDADKIAKASDVLKRMNIMIADTTGLNERKIIDRLDTVDNLGLVIIDSLQYVSCSHQMELPAQKTGIITRELKNFSKCG